jgi:hypothetical protein
MPRAPSTTAAKRIAAAATTGLSAGGDAGRRRHDPHHPVRRVASVERREHHETPRVRDTMPPGGWRGRPRPDPLSSATPQAAHDRRPTNAASPNSTRPAHYGATRRTPPSARADGDVLLRLSACHVWLEHDETTA